MKLGEVTIVKDCMICRREVILLARKNCKGELPKKDSILPQVCEDYKEKYLSNGVLLINPDNGSFVVIKDDAFKRLFTVEIPPRKIAFVDKELLDRFQEQEEVKQ